MSFDFQRFQRDKHALRKSLAAKTVAEKLRLLDAMRVRALALRAATSANEARAQEQPPGYGKNS